MKDKNREDVTEYHSRQDQADAAQKEETTRAKRSKHFVSFRGHVRCACAWVLRGGHRFHCPRGWRKIPLVFMRRPARRRRCLGRPA